MQSRMQAMRGFTLIELLIVVTVISILALIVIPRVSGATRQSREAALMTNLQEMRMAIMHFESDTGVYPLNLSDLVRLRTDPPTTGLSPVTGLEEAIPSSIMYNGPYLLRQGGINGSGIPFNTVILDYATRPLDEQWTYRLYNGEALISCPADIGRTLTGIPYEML